MRINCLQASRLISESMDRPLSIFERAALFFHLLACDFCANYRKQLAFLREAMTRWWGRNDSLPGVPPRAALSPEAKERIKKKCAGAEPGSNP